MAQACCYNPADEESEEGEEGEGEGPDGPEKPDVPPKPYRPEEAKGYKGPVNGVNDYHLHVPKDHSYGGYATQQGAAAGAATPAATPAIHSAPQFTVGQQGAAAYHPPHMLG